MIHYILKNRSNLKTLKNIKICKDCLLENQRKWSYSGKLKNSVPVTGFTEETGSGKSTLQFHSQAEMKASPLPCSPATKASDKTAACKKTRRHRAEPEQATESQEWLGQKNGAKDWWSVRRSAWRKRTNLQEEKNPSPFVRSMSTSLPRRYNPRQWPKAEKLPTQGPSIQLHQGVKKFPGAGTPGKKQV